MGVSFDFHDHVVDDAVDCVVVGHECRDYGGEGWRHGCTHYEEGLRDDAEGALPKVWHMSCVTREVLEI